MPIYEYQCEQCAQRLEALQKISDDPLQDCPECNQPALKKLVSAPSFRLKGGGWYETDFKTGDKKQLAESDSKEPKDSSKDTNKDDSGDSKSGDNKESKPGKLEKSESKSKGNSAKSDVGNTTQKKVS